jgi:hypothetical protein
VRAARRCAPALMRACARTAQWKASAPPRRRTSCRRRSPVRAPPSAACPALPCPARTRTRHAARHAARHATPRPPSHPHIHVRRVLCFAVRVLHARLRHAAVGRVAGAGRAHRARHARGAGRLAVPLHWLPPHRAGRAVRVAVAARRRPAGASHRLCSEIAAELKKNPELADRRVPLRGCAPLPSRPADMGGTHCAVSARCRRPSSATCTSTRPTWSGSRPPASLSCFACAVSTPRHAAG